jgi:hypothetical protein
MTALQQPLLAPRVSDARKNRAHKLFDDAIRERNSDNLRYAVYALGRAICEDPAQRTYAKEFLATLSSPAIKRPSWFSGVFKGFGLSRKMEKAMRESRWDDVLSIATQLAPFRPQNRDLLLALSQACVGLKCYDSAVVYLRFAHKLWPHDLTVNRHCGRVLGKVGMIDEAVGCWHRVKEHLPHDTEALTEMGYLTTKKILG